MLNSLYVEAVKKKGLVNEIIDEFSEGDSRIFDLWDEEIIPKYINDLKIASGDGSFNKKKFLSFYFYAIACESLIFTDKLETIENVEIDTLSHHKFSEDLLRTFMGLFEVKSALKVLEEYDVDYYLYDGSLLGDLIRPYSVGNGLSERLKNEAIQNCSDDLDDEIKKLKVEISSNKIITKYFKPYADKFELKIFLTSIEKLLTLKHLLKNKKKIIAISKTSTSNDLLNSNIPDIAIFDKYTKNSGFSKITYKNISAEIKHSFPVEDEFFKSINFTTFYLRLEDKKNVLKVELPYKASRDDIIEIISKLKKYSTDGYPYLLKKAHDDVVISNKDINDLSIIVNMYEKSGREMLN